MGDGAFPKRVEAAAVKVGAGAHAPLGARVGRVDDDADVEFLGLVRIDARAAELRGEQAGDSERLVADQLGGQASAGAAGEQPVLGISGSKSGRGGAGLAVGGGEDDRLEQFFGVPAAVDEVAGERVE